MTPYSPMSCEMSEKTTRYCWSTYFHATRLWLLLRIHQVLGPATMAYARHNFRHFGVDQQYPTLQRDTEKVRPQAAETSYTCLIFPSQYTSLLSPNVYSPSRRSGLTSG